MLITPITLTTPTQIEVALDEHADSLQATNVMSFLVYMDIMNKLKYEAGKGILELPLPSLYEDIPL